MVFMNTLTQEQINEIRNSVNIVDVISSYVSLTPKGKNYFGICPFHDDSNPSMSVSPERQIYKCFSCGATGTVFKFIMDFENVSFKEAVQKVANLGGIKVNLGKVKTAKTYPNLHQIYDLSLKFYTNNINTPQGKKAKEYLKNRDVDESIIKEFQIGLSLENDRDLAKILLSKFKPEDVLESGLVKKNEYGYFDLFYNRIMFPLYDLNGEVVAYSGRIYDRKDNSKYINTRETPIFKKGELLYNYHRAKEPARQKNQIIVVEGFMAAIRTYINGLPNVVATMGTAVTNTQAHLIKRLAKEVIICFDGDEAGAKGTLSFIDELTALGVNPKVVRLEDGLDPDDYIRQKGKDAFISKINHPQSSLEFKLSYLKKDKNLENSVDKASYIKEVIAEINKIDDDILREITISKVADEANIDKAFLKSHLTEKPKKEIETKVTQNIIKNKYEKAEAALVYHMLKSSEVIKMYDRKVTYMPKTEYRLLAREISEFYKKNGYINEADFLDYIEYDPDIMETIKKINQNNYSEKYTNEEIEDYINVIKDYNINSEVKRLTKKMDAETDPLKQAAIAQKIIDLRKGE